MGPDHPPVGRLSGVTVEGTPSTHRAIAALALSNAIRLPYIESREPELVWIIYGN
jgi:hypothetical protein